MKHDTDSIVASLEARAQELVEEHGRIERALAELRPEHPVAPPQTRKKRAKLPREELRARVLAVLRGAPEESFTIAGLAERIAYNGPAVQRELIELVESGEAITLPSTAGGHAKKFPRYAAASPSEQLSSASREVA